MAYIIGEPIINVTGTSSGHSRLTVRFPVLETHSGERHYRGVTIILDPEKLWMLGDQHEPPPVLPDMPVHTGSVDVGTYVDTLIATAELQDELKKLAEEDGIDLDYPEHIERWKIGAVKRASERCKERKK
ncbi:MAG: hypothetical protein DRP83_00165 [Planctomycetota bacterium]|nr:MAG: hypothetical protein DRP83_00165 [Planctomycetota bacterium]